MIDVEIDRREELEAIRDQGPLPTCLAYATSTAHRIYRNVERPLSAESLHYQANEGDLSRACTIESLQRALMENGQPEDRHCEPIPDSDPNSWSPPTDVQVYRSNSNNTNSVIQTVLESIRSREFPIIGISLPEEFYNPVPPWIISGGKSGPLHAVVGTGLAKVNNKEAVLIQNSWGEDWGNAGYAWLDHTFLNNHLEAVLLIENEVGS